MIKNAGFEGVWWRKTHTGQEFGEIFVPEYWVAFWKESGPVPWDPQNNNGFGRPEMQVINREPPFLDPPRIRSGNRALKYFTFFRIHDAGLYQQVDVEEGARVTVRAFAHAWSSTSDNPRCSDGSNVGCKVVALREGDPNLDDADRNFTFRVGVDPTGGTDPWADSVVWGAGAHIYNGYAQVPEASAVAEGDRITVFLRSTVLWPFKHCDAYWDDVELVLEPISSPEPPPVGPPPTESAYPWVTRGTKLFPHGIASAGTLGLLETMSANGVSVPFVKVVIPAVETLPSIKEMKEAAPDSKLVVRLMQVKDGTNVEGPNFYGRPEEYMASVLSTIEGYEQYIDYLELWNEQDPVGVYGHIRMANFAVRCMEIAKEHNLKLAVMSYSMGVPEYGEWKAILEHTQFFQTCLSGGHVVSYHAYGYTDSDDTQWILLRYKSFWEQELAKHGLVVPILYTEYAVPEGFNRNNHAIEEMGRFDEMISRIWYILGAAVFTFGGASSWPDFNMDPLLDEFADYVKSVSPRENAEPPGQSPAPHEGYDRYYIVADPNLLSPARLDEVYRSARARLRTVGPSHEDANPVPWPEGVRSNTVEIPGVTAENVQEFTNYHMLRNPQTTLVFPDYTPANDPLADFPWNKDISQELPRRTDYENFDNVLKDVGWRKSLSDVNAVTIHHVGALATPRAVALSHIQRSGGTPSIHYHIWIERDGTTLLTAPLEDRLWHDHTWDAAHGMNHHLSVVLNGDLTKYPPTREQMISLVRVVKWALLYKEFNIPRTGIKGHQDWNPATECPGWSSPGGGYWKGEFFDILSKSGAGVSGTTGRSVIGFHAPPTTTPPLSYTSIIDAGVSLGMQWYTFLDEGDPRNVEMCRYLVARGVIPVVRLYSGAHMPNRNGRIELVARYRECLDEMQAQYPLLILAYNEPNLPVEWPSERRGDCSLNNPDALRVLAESWWADAKDVISMGGMMGFPVMAPTNRNGRHPLYSGPDWAARFVDEVIGVSHGEALDLAADNKFWLPVHNAAFGRPFEFSPWRDAQGEGTDAESAVYIDDMCLRAYEAYQRIYSVALGVKPLTIATEGGVYSPYHMWQLGWTHDPERVWYEHDPGRLYYDNNSWGKVLWEAMGFLETGELAGMCQWHLRDGFNPQWDGAGIYDKDGNPRSPALG